MPNVAVHDLVIQPKAKHLLIGTHGRSIYKADISQLQLISPEILASSLYVFNLKTIKHAKNWGSAWSSWAKPKTPGLDITFYSSTTNVYKAIVKSESGIEVSSAILNADPGVNIISFDVAFTKNGKANYIKKNKTKLVVAKNGKTYLPKGKYTVEISSEKQKETKTFTIE